VDSVALISLMSELKAAGIATGSAAVVLDGQEMSLSEALKVAGGGKIDVITVKEGSALVEVTTETLEDWSSFQATLPVRTKLKNAYQSLFRRGFHLGDLLELTVSVDKYEAGLVLQVCLPPCLSSLQGGGEVKRFSVDFCGHNKLTIPLQVTGHTLPNGEHWAVLVRNMFNEEQVGNPGMLTINVATQSNIFP
jgi:flagellar hook-basal body complex protein FliE